MSMDKGQSSWSLTSESPLVERKKREHASHPSLHAVSKEMNTRDKKGRTPLFIAVRKGDVKQARKLLYGGADPNIADNFGVTPLHEVTERDNIEMMDLLIEQGADLNAKNILGQTPLMRAVLYDEKEGVETLYKAGADIEARDCTGKTALMLALQENRVDMVSYLLQIGCNLHITDRLGQTPLYISMKESKRVSREIIRKLVKHGYDLNRDSHWLKESDLEKIECLAEDAPPTGLFQKLMMKIKPQQDKIKVDPVNE